MTWIRVDCALPRHPKVARLARTLGTSRHEAIGILIDLWTWAVDYGGDDGDLGRYSAEELVTALAIHQPDALIQVDLLDALEASGFVDRGDGDRLLLHDWLDLQGALVAQREANRERQRRYRDRKCDSVTPVTVPVTVTSPLPNAASPLPNGATYERNERTNITDDSQPVFEFGELVPVTGAHLAKWRGLFVDLDIAVEIEKMKLYLASAPASKRPKKSLPRFALNWLQRANADMQRASVTNQKEQVRNDQLAASSEEIRQQAESKRDQMAARSEEEIREQAKLFYV